MLDWDHFGHFCGSVHFLLVVLLPNIQNPKWPHLYSENFTTAKSYLGLRFLHNGRHLRRTILERKINQCIIAMFCILDKIFRHWKASQSCSKTAKFGGENVVKCERYDPIKFANFVYFSITLGKLIPLSMLFNVVLFRTF